MEKEIQNPGSYEGATTITLPDGRWCFMADFFGCEKDKLGCVPFISSKPGDMSFTHCPDVLHFALCALHYNRNAVSELATCHLQFL